MGADEAASAAGAVVVVCCALWFLASPVRPVARSVAMDDALQVVWVERAGIPVVEPPRLPAPVPAAARAPLRVPAATRATGPVMFDAHPAEDGAPVELDLSLPHAPVAFRGDGHGRKADVAREPVLRVTFHDRSLGGRLGRMARAMTCGELQQALLEHPESAAAIEGAMSRHRCGGQPARHAPP